MERKEALKALEFALDDWARTHGKGCYIAMIEGKIKCTGLDEIPVVGVAKWRLTESQVTNGQSCQEWHNMLKYLFPKKFASGRMVKNADTY